MNVSVALTLSIVSSCAGGPGPTDGGVPVRTAYSGSDPFDLRVSETPSPLKARMPVLAAYPPEYFPVYVPSHVSAERDMLIGDHWVIIKLKDSTWLPEKRQEDIETNRIAGQGDIDLLRRRIEPAFHRMLVPRRGN